MSKQGDFVYVRPFAGTGRPSVIFVTEEQFKKLQEEYGPENIITSSRTFTLHTPKQELTDNDVEK